MAKRSTAGLLKYVKFLMEAGVMKRPIWLDAVERVPPAPLPKVTHRPPTITFPEDEIVRAYYRRNPAASLEPIDLGSYEPNTARRFAQRQLQLMEQGLSRKDAKKQTETEFASAAQVDLREGGHETIVQKIQNEEANHLEEALEMYRENHGHEPSFGGHRGGVNSKNRNRSVENGDKNMTPPLL